MGTTLHRQRLASAGSIQLTNSMHGAAEPVSSVASKQLPYVTVVRMHNVPGGINVHGLMACLLEHFQLGAGYSAVSEYGGDASGDIAAVTPTWCRSDVCIAELGAPMHDAKLAFTCFGQQVSVSVQPSILAKAHIYHQKAQAQTEQATTSSAISSQSPRHKRRHKQKARAQQAELRQAHLPQQRQPLHATYCPAVLPKDSLALNNNVALKRPLDHTTAEPMQVEPSLPAANISCSSSCRHSSSSIPT